MITRSPARSLLNDEQRFNNSFDEAIVGQRDNHVESRFRHAGPRIRSWNRVKRHFNRATRFSGTNDGTPCSSVDADALLAPLIFY